MSVLTDLADILGQHGVQVRELHMDGDMDVGVCWLEPGSLERLTDILAPWEDFPADDRDAWTILFREVET